MIWRRSPTSDWTLPLLLLPGVGVLGVLFGLPLVWALLGSFGLQDGGHFTAANYASLFTDPLSRAAFFRSVYYGAVPVVLTLLISVPLAALIQKRFLGQKLFSGLYKIPLAVPSIVVAFMALTLLERGGFIDRLLAPLGLNLPRLVRDPAGIGVILSAVWKNVPFMTLIITGAFAAIPEEITNAARSLGANRLKTFFRVQIPLAMPGITAALLLDFILSLGSFALPNLLGPAYPPALTVLMYDAFQRGEWARVYAIGMILTAFAMLVLGLYYALLGRRAGGGR